MKRSLFIASLFIAFAATAAFAAPVIFFSDLTSGPNTGGQDNKGVFVTIVGKGFGAAQGTGSVSIGGGKADNYPLWSDSKITFQLGAQAATGDITVSNAGGTSNGLPFKVRPGRVFFVDDTSPNSPGSGTYADPWRSPRSFFTAEQPGDTCYFRQGTYPGQYGNAGRPYNVSFYNSGIPNGAPDNEIAWAGYPNETALFKADDNTVYNGAFELSSDNQYFVIAGLSIYGRGDGREQVRLYSDNCKLVNNRIEGIKTLSYGMVGVIASNLKIWGNEMTGATSGNKLDHVIYFQSGRSMDNVDIGWNNIHNNDIAVGPMFSWNLGSSTVTNIRIHDNLLDCRNSSDILRLAGIWSGGGGDVTFANNLVIGAGGSLNNDDAYNGIYDAFAKLYVYNNTFYLSKGAGSNYVINLYGSATGDIRNNIFYNSGTISYVKGSATLANNLYYGGAGSVPSGDANKLTTDPGFANAGTLDLHLLSTSPCIDKGSDTTIRAPRDYDGVMRAASAVDVGAYEYYVTGQPDPGTDVHPGSGSQPPAGASIGGIIKDAAGAGINDVSVALSGGAQPAAVKTAGNGSYQFTGLAPSTTFVLTPAKTGWQFSPASLTVTTSGTGTLAAGQNFTATPLIPLYTISGTIHDPQGAGVGGATVTLGGGIAKSVTSAGDGSFRFTDVPANTIYSITPAKAGWVFRPAVFAINTLTGDYTVPDFAGLRTFSIEGRVLDNQGNAVAGADLALSGDAPQHAVSGNDGSYAFAGLVENSSYTVKVSKNGYYFTPSYLSIAAVGGALTGWNFNATNVNIGLAAGQVRVIGSAAGRGTVNPDKGETPKIYFKGSGVGRFDCRIFTLTGELVWESAMHDVQDGTFEWAPHNVASGIYTVQVKGPGVNACKKIAILR